MIEFTEEELEEIFQCIDSIIYEYGPDTLKKQILAKIHNYLNKEEDDSSH